jgi:hypothetical protein
MGLDALQETELELHSADQFEFGSQDWRDDES